MLHLLIKNVKDSAVIANCTASHSIWAPHSKVPELISFPSSSPTNPAPSDQPHPLPPPLKPRPLGRKPLAQGKLYLLPEAFIAKRLAALTCPSRNPPEQSSRHLKAPLLASIPTAPSNAMLYILPPSADLVVGESKQACVSYKSKNLTLSLPRKGDNRQQY